MNDIEKAIETLQRLSDTHIDNSYDILSAIEASKEKQEREKGCNCCYGIPAINIKTLVSIEIKNNKIVLQDGNTDVELSYGIDYCPVWGRKLNIANKT